MVFTSWNLCWMHKPQKCTLELELPVERRPGAAHGTDAALAAGAEAGRGHSQPFGSTLLGSPAFSWVGRRLPPLWFTWAASAQQGCLRVCFQHMLFIEPPLGGDLTPGTEGRVELPWCFSDLVDRTLCQVCAHGVPSAFNHPREVQ